MKSCGICWIVGLAALGACAAPRRHLQLIPVASNPAPAYPLALRDSGFTGDVVVQMEVAGSGEVIPSTVEVVNETNPAFTDEVKKVVPAWRFERAPGDSSTATVQQRFHFKVRPPTPAECRALLSHEFAVDTTRAQSLRVLQSESPGVGGRGGHTRTLAEFVVDTLGRADVKSLRIVESTLPDQYARADLERVLDEWRFAPARIGGCAYASKAQYEFVY